MTPRLTPGERPKSSAFTISTRSAISASPCLAEAELAGELERLAEPVVSVLGGRPPVPRPAEPLQCEVEPASGEVGLELGGLLGGRVAAQVGGYQTCALLVIPASDQRRQIDQARPRRRHLPVHRTDPRWIAEDDEDVGGIELAVHEGPGEGGQGTDDVLVALQGASQRGRPL